MTKVAFADTNSSAPDGAGAASHAAAPRRCEAKTSDARVSLAPFTDSLSSRNCSRIGEAERREPVLRFAVVSSGCRSQDACRVDADQPAGAVAVDLREPRVERAAGEAAAAPRARPGARPEVDAANRPSGECQR